MIKQGDLQLLPETRRKLEIKVPGENKILASGVVILIISVLIIAFLYIYSQRLIDQITDANSRISAIEKQRDKNFEKQLVTFSKQAGMISQFLNEHLYWSDAMKKIENLIQSQVQLKSFNASSNGEISINAVTSNYATLAKQIASFTSEEAITEINLQNIQTKPDNKLEFSMKLVFNKDKLLR